MSVLKKYVDGEWIPVVIGAGPRGEKGDPSSVDLGTVTVATPDQNPSVTNSGTVSDAVFDFSLPRASDVSIGSVVTGEPGSPATVTDSGTDGDVVLDFSIPKGLPWNESSVLGDFADVTAPSPKRGDQLVYDGSDWVAADSGAVTHVSGLGYQGWAFVVDDRYVYTRGVNNNETARGATGQVQQPHRLVFPGETGRVVKMGLMYSGYALFDTGNLWVWGHNNQGQLGTGNTTAQPNPVLSATGVVKFFRTKNGGRAIGEQHAFILKDDGLWYSVGYNGYGQLGDATTTRRTSWTLSSSLNSIHATDPIDRVEIQGCVYGMSIAISENDNIYAAGYNANGALGDGTTTSRSSFVDVTSNWGGNGMETLIVQGVAGYDGTASSTITMLRRDKTTDERYIYGAGQNSWGMLGDNTTTQRTTPVVAGSSGTSSIGTDIVDYVMFGGGPASCYALDSSGVLHVWGYNGFNQLGDGTGTQRNQPIVGTTDVEKILIRESDASTVPHYATGFIKKTDGIVYGVGRNNTGQIGDGTTTQRSSWTPVYVPGNVVSVHRVGYQDGGQSHIFFMDDGQIFGTGYNGHRALYDWTTTACLVPIPIQVPRVPINI